MCSNRHRRVWIKYSLTPFFYSETWFSFNLIGINISFKAPSAALSVWTKRVIVFYIRGLINKTLDERPTKTAVTNLLCLDNWEYEYKIRIIYKVF